MSELSAKNKRILARLENTRISRVYRLSETVPLAARRRSTAYELFLSECDLSRKTYKRLRRRAGLTKAEIELVSLRQMPGWFANLQISTFIARYLRGLGDIAGFVSVAPGVWMLDVADFEGWSFLAAERDALETGLIKNLVNFRSAESGVSFRIAARPAEKQISRSQVVAHLDRQVFHFWRSKGWEPEQIAALMDAEFSGFAFDEICRRILNFEI